MNEGSTLSNERVCAQTTDGGVMIRGVGVGVSMGVGGRHTGAGGAVGGGGGVRRSLPNMATSHLLHEPAKLYPYHLLLITNYRLPPDVDRLNLEVRVACITYSTLYIGTDLIANLCTLCVQRHLSDAEFEAILQIGRQDFYRLPQWRRNELKRRARLF